MACQILERDDTSKKNYWVDYPENQDDDSTISISLDGSM